MLTIQAPQKATHVDYTLSDSLLRAVQEAHGAVDVVALTQLVERFGSACAHWQARRQRVTAICSVSGEEYSKDAVETLQDYYRELCFLETRFRFGTGGSSTAVSRALRGKRGEAAPEPSSSSASASERDVAVVPVVFSWYDAVLSNKKCALADSRLEKAAVAFNIGTCYAARGRRLVASDTAGAAEFQAAGREFQLAAGYFAWLQRTPLHRLGDTMTPDLQTKVLKVLELCMLANAQLCVLELAISSKKSLMNTSRIASGAAELLCSVRVRLPEKYFPPLFVEVVDALQLYASAQAEFHCALDLDDEGSGNVAQLLAKGNDACVERLWRYHKAAQQAEAALRKSAVAHNAFLSARLQAIAGRCNAAARRCEQENAVVFQIESGNDHAERRIRELPAVGSTVLVSVPDTEALSTALGEGAAARRRAVFHARRSLPNQSPLLALARIVPRELSLLAQKYRMVAGQRIGDEVTRLRQANATARDLRRTLNVAALVDSIPPPKSNAAAKSKRLGEVPESVQGSTLVKFRKLLQEIPDGDQDDEVMQTLARRCAAEMQRVEEWLREEERADANWSQAARVQNGHPESAVAQRPYRAALTDLRKQLALGAEAQRMLRARVRTTRAGTAAEATRLLERQQGESALTATGTADGYGAPLHRAPAVTDIDREHPAAAHLVAVLVRMAEIERRRERLALEMHERFMTDHFGDALLEEDFPAEQTEVDGDALISRRLASRYGRWLQQAQDLVGGTANNMLADLTAALNAFHRARGELDASLARAVDEAGRVHRAIEDLQGIVEAMHQGRGFYAKLLQNVERLSEDVHGFCKARQLHTEGCLGKAEAPEANGWSQRPSPSSSNGSRSNDSREEAGGSGGNYSDIHIRFAAMPSVADAHAAAEVTDHPTASRATVEAPLGAPQFFHAPPSVAHTAPAPMRPSGVAIARGRGGRASPPAAAAGTRHPYPPGARLPPSNPYA